MKCRKGAEVKENGQCRRKWVTNVRIKKKLETDIVIDFEKT